MAITTKFSSQMWQDNFMRTLDLIQKLNPALERYYSTHGEPYLVSKGLPHDLTPPSECEISGMAFLTPCGKIPINRVIDGLDIEVESKVVSANRGTHLHIAPWESTLSLRDYGYGI